MANNIGACHPTIYPLPGDISETGLPAGALIETRRVDTSGLVKGGGALTQDRQLSVDAATAADVAAGTKADAAVTPAALKPTLDAQTASVTGKADKAANLSDLLSIPTAKQNLALDLVSNTSDAAKALTTNPVGLAISFTVSITRADIATSTIPLRSFRVAGYLTIGDLGAGALYVRGTSSGLLAIQDAGGTWWNLSVSGNSFNSGHLGIKGDGSDEGAAIVAAIASIPSGADIVFPRPPVFYGTSIPIPVGNGYKDGSGNVIPSTQQDIGIIGASGSSGTQNQLNFPYVNVSAVRFVAVGSNPVSKIFDFRGPIKIRFRGIVVDGNALADTAFNLMHVFGSSFLAFGASRIRNGWRQDSYSNPIQGGGPNLSVAIGSADNSYKDFYFDTTGYTDGTCLDIGYDEHLGVGLDINRDNWENGKLSAADNVEATMIRLRGTDLVNFKAVLGYGAGQRRAKAIRVRSPIGAPHLPTEIVFYNCPLIGQFEIEWDGSPAGSGRAPGHPFYNPDYNGGYGIGFYPLANGDRSDPTYLGAGNLNLPYGFYGIDDRGNFFGFRPQMGNFFAGFRYDAPAALYRLNTPVTVQNTASEGTLLATSIPAYIMQTRPQNQGAFTNLFVWDRRLRIRLSGTVLNNTGADQTFNFRLGFGGVNLFVTGAQTVATLPAYRRWTHDQTVAPTGNVFNKLTADGEFRLFDNGSVGVATSGAMLKTLGGHNTNLTQDLGTAANLFAAVTLSGTSTVLAMTLDEALIELV